MIKGVIFDMDGVLINSEIYYYNALIRLIESDGKKVDREDFKKIVGLSGKASRDVIAFYYEEDFDHKDFMKRFRKGYMGENIDYKTILFPYVHETLQKLKSRGLKLALASSSSMRTITQAIEQTGIKDYFDFIIGGDKVENPKPDSEIYLKAMEGLGLNKDNCIAVEDSFVGIKAAKNAGLFTIAKKDFDFSMNQAQANIILEDMTLLNTIIEIIEKNKTEFEYSSLDYGSKLFLQAHILNKEIKKSNLSYKDLFRLALKDDSRLAGYLEIDLKSKEEKGQVIVNPLYEETSIERELLDSLKIINDFYLK